MSTESIPLTIRAQVCRHDPEGHMKPMQWLIHNPAFSGTSSEWVWGSRDRAKFLTPEEADMLARRHGGWPEIIGGREQLGHADRDVPRTLKSRTDELVVSGKGKPNSERTNAERVAIARQRRLTRKPTQHNRSHKTT